MSNDYGNYGTHTKWHDPTSTKTRIFILVHAGCVTDVYADSNNVEVEIIDTDGEDEHDEALKRADEVQATYEQVL